MASRPAVTVAILVCVAATVVSAVGTSCGPSAAVQSRHGVRCVHTPASPAGTPIQCCCDVAGEEHQRCLPHVIIAGAQKSGTTALYGHLLLHPMFQGSVRKELHFFDSTRVKPDNVTAYLRGFPIRAEGKVTGEATPSYMAGFYTAERMAAMVPTARVVVVLRDPVERFYSEYMMKWRRVQLSKANDSAVDAAVAACRNEPLRKATDARDALRQPWTACFLRLMRQQAWFEFQVGSRAAVLKPFRACVAGVLTSLATDVVPVDAVQACFRDIKREDLLPLRTVVDREVETLEDCSRRPPLKRAQRTLLLDGREVAEPLLEWGTERCWKTGTDSNIARDFLFRGLYYPQLVRMLKSFPSDQVLILDSDELQKSATKTMTRVWKFLGMPVPHEGVVPTDDQVHAAFTAKFPRFEVVTGWRMRSVYEAPMPEDIAARLRRVYAPFNQQLFQLLNRTLPWQA